ncbi:hypothetical protein XBKQ1_1310004 [Xenorhabdus bovienii str. kraussei Quebec]|uniref:Uncharacterized protein n=1 Tax=Xenorhabdus bovienii str. kraussei Quebec TaxID=1398203 RepID=A0A077PCZ2_XENBV|nr:hypothetical protein XBKQ1_1310004 [Xenorhabdus bovienii str. kraussei Quebec]
MDKMVKILRRDTFFGYKRIDLKVESRPGDSLFDHHAVILNKLLTKKSLSPHLIFLFYSY